MQSFRRSIRLLQSRNFTGSNNVARKLGFGSSFPNRADDPVDSSRKLASFSPVASIEKVSLSDICGGSFSPASFRRSALSPAFLVRGIATVGDSAQFKTQGSSEPVLDVPPRIKFKRLDKTSKHIMQILDKEAVEEVRAQREIPDIKPGYIVQLKVEVPENKRRISTVKGIVIARRNAGLNTTFRIRRLVAGVGVESLFPLYSPNLKEIKVLDKKKVRRAKLYYLRDKMNALKKH